MRSTITAGLVAAAALIAPVAAVYRDEAYTVDYHHALLGLPAPDATFFHRPDASSPASLLYTLSDLGVLGAVKPGSGDLVWRQYLAANSNRTIGGKGTDNEIEGLLRPVEGEDKLVSAVGGYVNAWEATTGKERWYNDFEGVARDLEIIQDNTGEKDVLVLFESREGGARESVVRRLDGKTGDVKWEHHGERGDLTAQVNADGHDNVHVVSLHSALIGHGYNIRITTLDSVTGLKKVEHTLTSKADVHSRDDVLFVGSNAAAPIVAWASKDKRTIHVNILGHKDVQNLHIDGTKDITSLKIHAPQSAKSKPHFLVHAQGVTNHWAVVYQVDVKSGSIVEAYELPALAGKGAFSTSEVEDGIFFTRITNEEMILYPSDFKTALATYPLTVDVSAGVAVHAVSEVVKKAEFTFAVRSAVVTSEDNWQLIKNGAPGWTRTEGLSGAVAAAFAEIPEVETLAKALDVEAHSNPIAAYSHRLTRHMGELQNLPSYLAHIPMRIFNAMLPGDVTPVDAGALARDNFGFRKLVILATERGRVYCLDTANAGKVVWSHRAFEIPAGQKWDVKGVFVDNAKGEVMIKGANDEYVVLKAVDGATVELQPQIAGVHVQSTAVVDSAAGKHLLDVLEGGLLPILPGDKAPKDTLVVRGPAGSINGMKFFIKENAAHADAIWTFKPASGERILSVSARPSHDPVASIGSALADRSVLYKYLNPNLVLVTAVNDVTSTLTLYLLDSVNGAVIYSAIHSSVDTTQPIATAISENWFTYSFFAFASTTSSAQGYQLVISELYESAIPNDRGANPSGNYSSLEPSEVSGAITVPHVVSQSFIVPEPISHLGVTQTRQGITSRVLVASLPRSNGILAIPRNLVDARRQVRKMGKPSVSDMEEGVVPYSPVLDFDPRGLLSHERQVVGVKNIITSPALLESTSLVFAYGLDIFGTRAMPSGAFDVLGVGFNKVTLMSTVIGLFIAVMMVAPMVRKKMIDGKWRS